MQSVGHQAENRLRLVVKSGKLRYGLFLDRFVLEKMK